MPFPELFFWPDHSLRFAKASASLGKKFGCTEKAPGSSL
jgi:hypothetical protein